MAKGKIYRFTVRGAGSFPVDMLRYDQCWPVENVIAVAPSRFSDAESWGTREIQMMSHNQPTPDRWMSFGWACVDVRSAY